MARSTELASMLTAYFALACITIRRHCNVRLGNISVPVSPTSVSMALIGALIVDLAVGGAAGGILAGHLSSKNDDSEPFGGKLFLDGGALYIPMDYAQRCYSFAWGRFGSAKWKNFPDVEGQIAFFEKDECQGEHRVTSNKRNGQFNFAGEKKWVASAMITTYSAYPLRGLETVRSKTESTRLRATSNASGVNSTVEYYRAQVNSSWEEDMDEVGLTPLRTNGTTI